MLSFSRWIAQTGLSDFVRDLLWIIPTVQTVHILALALLFTSVGAVALASYGRLGGRISPAATASRFAPWVWGALVVLLVTGSILIVGEPERELINWAFWIKIPLIVVAGLATAVLMSRLGKDALVDGSATLARSRGVALVLVLLWALVIVFGRLIAYAQIVSD